MNCAICNSDQHVSACEGCRVLVCAAHAYDAREYDRESWYCKGCRDLRVRPSDIVAKRKRFLEEQGRVIPAVRNDNHHDGETTVCCLLGDTEGYPYANRMFRAVADQFAEQYGLTIENWNPQGWFDAGGVHYQVVADRKCIDVIRRHYAETKEAK